MRELRAGSVISAGLSILVVVVASLSLVGSSTPKEMRLWIGAIAAGLALTATSMLYTATEKKKFGLVHGALMAIAAITLFCCGVLSLPDRTHWQGGFVEMVQVPVAGGLMLFSIAAAGSALQTFLYVVEKKGPNQSPEPTRSARGSS